MKCSSQRCWKVVKSLSLGLDIARWFSRALEGSLKTGRKEFYIAHCEGGRGFIAQRCSNFCGFYMALVEYGGGGRCSFIFIPADRDGVGWRKLAGGATGCWWRSQLKLSSTAASIVQGGLGGTSRLAKIRDDRSTKVRWRTTFGKCSVP